MFHTDCLTQVVETDCLGFPAVEHLAGSGVILMACHTSGGVIEDQYCACGLVVNHVHQRVDACVEECGISNQGNPVLDVIFALCLLHAMQGGDGSAHAHGCVYDI